MLDAVQKKRSQKGNNEHHDTTVPHTGQTIQIEIGHFLNKYLSMAADGGKILPKSHQPLLDAVQCTWKKKPNRGNNEHHDTTVPHTGEQLKLVIF